MCVYILHMYIWASLVAQWQRICLPIQAVFLPWKSHGQRSLVGYSPWSGKRVRHNLATKQQKPQYV